MNKYEIITKGLVYTRYVIDAESEEEATQEYGGDVNCTEFEWGDEEIIEINKIDKK